MPVKVREISVEEYDKGFRAFRDKCEGRQAILVEFLQKEVKDIAVKKGAPLNVLSIGAGYGEFEDNLFNQPEVKVSYYHGIEISLEYRKILEEKCQTTWAAEKYYIDGTPFSDEYKFPEDVSYDLILFIHSLYYIPNAIKSLVQAIHRLSSNDYSRIAIMQVGQLGLCQLYEEMASSFEWVESINSEFYHGLSGEKIVSLLQECNDVVLQRRLKNQCKKELKGTLDVTDLLAETEAGNEIIKFMLMTDLDSKGIDRAYKEKFLAKVNSLLDSNLSGSKIPHTWIALCL